MEIRKVAVIGSGTMGNGIAQVFAASGFDTVMIATFTLSNDNAYAVKDIRIRCELSGNSGTNIDTAEETIYDSIPASTTRTFPDVSMGFVRSQTSRANCEIKSAVRSY